jgi:hypothetical protein
MADDVSLKVGIDTEAAIKSLANLEKNAVNSTKRMESAFSALKGVAVAAVGFLAARGVLNFFEEGIAGAVAQEQAFARLEAQMIATGENTEEAAKAFNDLASELESTTKFGDDAVLAAAALAKSYGITNQQALELTRTAADLASATGVELEAAVEQLTASYSGNVKALGKLVPEVKGLTKEQLAAGEAVELLGKRFSGAANKEIQTYAGAVKQASNAFENFREAFGTLITQNKAVVAVINGIGKLFQALQKVVEDNQEAFTEFINFGVKALVVGISIAVDSLRALVAGFGFVAESALQTAAAVFAAFGDIARAIEKVTGRSAFSEFFDEAALKAANFSEDTTESISKIDAVFEKVSVAVDEFSQGVFDATEAVDTGAKKAEKSTAALGRQIVQTAKDTEKLREEGEKFLADLKKTGATDTQKVVLDAEEAFKKLGQLVKEGALTANQAREASLQITKNQILKEIELRDKANKQLIEDAKKAAEEARKRIADIAADPVTFTVKKLDIQPLDISQQAQESAALGVGFVSKVLEGAAGAKSLISAGAGAFADSLLPGIGGAVGGLISKLAEGPDATKKFVKEFTAAVPVIVEAIAESAPVFVEALIDSLVNKGGAVKIGIAIARAMSGEAIAKNIGKQIGVQFGSSFSPETIGSKIASGFVTVGDKLLATFTNIGSLLYNSIFGAFIAGGQQIISFFGQALAQIPQAFVTAGEAILAPIRDFFTIDFSSLISGAFASVIDFFRGAGLFDGVNAAFKPIIDFLDAFKIEVPGGSGPQKSGGLISGTGTPLDFLAKGGIVYAANGFVPRGTDTVPAMLTPGEMVLNRSQQSSLFNLANSGGGGSEVVGLLGQLIDLLSVPMTTEVSAEVNGKTIADIVLQQSRQRARLSV